MNSEDFEECQQNLLKLMDTLGGVLNNLKHAEAGDLEQVKECLAIIHRKVNK